jgi:hypothetical protein
MKRLFVLFVALFLTLTASAQMRDSLLTPNGTFFSVEVEQAIDNPEVVTDSLNYFVLMSRKGIETKRDIIPATLVQGIHTDPAIAYDAESGMLFLLWLRHSGLLYNQILVASRDSEGVWSEPVAIGGLWDYRQNLRIAVTRKVFDEETETLVPGISVHASWWELSTSGREGARYAMLSIEQGAVAEVQELDLAPYVEPAGAQGPEDLDPAVLRQPLLHTSPQRDSVLITFGDLATRSMNQVRVKPSKVVSDGRLRVPIGKRESQTPAPRFGAAANGTIDAVYGGGDRLALIVRGTERLDYVIFKDGVWSESQAVTLDEHVSSTSAVDAVRRLLNEH